MKAVKNMRELDLVKRNLRYQELLYEKELTKSSTNIINNVGDSLKNFAIELSTKMVLLLLKKVKKNH